MKKEDFYIGLFAIIIGPTVLAGAVTIDVMKEEGVSTKQEAIISEVFNAGKPIK